MGFLPGLGGVFAQPATLQLFASNTSSSSTITVPASVADGDVAVLIDRGSAIGVPSAVTPAGYTLQASVSGGSFMRVTVLTKVLSSSDAGATVTGMNASNDRKVMLVFRRSPVVATVAASAITSATSAGSNPAAAAASYTGVSGSSATIGIVACLTTDSISGATFSPTATGAVSSDTHLTVNYLLTASGDPGSCSVDQGDSGGNEHINVLLNLALS